MSMKSWVLHRVQEMGAATGRPDLAVRGGVPRREPVDDGGPGPRAAAVATEPMLSGSEHLGAYAPLIEAVRDELQHFVASHVRLHVVIAERDRFLLTSIVVRSPGGAQAREMLVRFMREFRPEQVKRYLAREVIGRLPNAAVIDLAQFAGLCDLGMHDAADAGDEYAELLASLRTTVPAAPQQPYEIEVIGRWSETDMVSPVTGLRSLHTAPTPLAGRRCEFSIDDGEGPRKAALESVAPGRRYTIGKGASCDIRVDGTYTSRRHAEVWFERDVWYVADAGSTNGIRIEGAAAAPPGAKARAASPGAAKDGLAWAAGARLVLSARAEGPPRDYPCITLQPARADGRSAPVTPIAVASPRLAAVPTTVVYVRTTDRAFDITRSQADGTHVHPVGRMALPITIGRSRDQSVVIDGAFQGVSGHHVSIDGIEADGVRGIVLGDNGVAIDGVAHAAGARFAWHPGQAMVLGGSLDGEASCSLALVAPGSD